MPAEQVLASRWEAVAAAWSGTGAFLESALECGVHRGLMRLAFLVGERDAMVAAEPAQLHDGR